MRRRCDRHADPFRGAQGRWQSIDGIKSQILQRLTRGATLRFSTSLGAEYYLQVASERQVVRYVKGAPVRRFERVPGRRAEALDCLVYALAVRHALTLNLDKRAEELASPAAPRSMPVRVKSKWLAVPSRMIT
ncbi:MAG: phage terminase large subunit family protein [Pseudorhodobacter sp.]|nr:phage terminase large subunit family protein [Pseudorhodobacter sp.]